MILRPALLVLLTTAAVTVAGAGPASAGGGCHADRPTEASGARVELRGNCMAPTVLHVDEGTEVTFANTDPVMHNVFGFRWGHDPLAPGDEWTRRFDEAGTFPYTCSLHPGMTGAIVVGDDVLPADPIASVTDVEADGGGSFPMLAVGAVALATASGFAAGRVSRRRREA